MSDNGTQAFGRFFEDFEVGDVYRNWPGRTISEADDTWFSLLTQNQNPIHIDANYAAESHRASEVSGERHIGVCDRDWSVCA